MEAACRDAGGERRRAPVRDRRAEARVRRGAASAAPHGASAATKPGDADRRWLAREASGGERGRRRGAPPIDERIESDKFGGDKGRSRAKRFRRGDFGRTRAVAKPKGWLGAEDADNRPHQSRGTVALVAAKPFTASRLHAARSPAAPRPQRRAALYVLDIILSNKLIMHRSTPLGGASYYIIIKYYIRACVGACARARPARRQLFAAAEDFGSHSWRPTRLYICRADCTTHPRTKKRKGESNADVSTPPPGTRARRGVQATA